MADEKDLQAAQLRANIAQTDAQIASSELRLLQLENEPDLVRGQIEQMKAQRKIFLDDLARISEQAKNKAAPKE